MRAGLIGSAAQVEAAAIGGGPASRAAPGSAGGRRVLWSMFLAVAALEGCGDASVSTAPCDVGSIERLTGVVVVDDTEPVCDIVIREVVRLKGSVTGKAPKMPVTMGPDGVYVTATYSKGEVAVWSPSGDLIRTFGNGPGEGPGEFDSMYELEVDSAGLVSVFPGTGGLHRYTLEGAFIESVRLPGSAWRMATLPSGGMLVAIGMDGSPLTLVEGDSIREIGPSTQPGAISFPVAGHGGYWTANMTFYEAEHHVLPDGDVDLTIHRQVAWYPPPGPTAIRTGSDYYRDGGTVSSLAVDNEQVIWMQANHVTAIESPDDDPEITPYLEAFTVDGRLLGVTTFDRWRDAPRPITAKRWFIVLDDVLSSIQIVEPVLVARGGG